MFRRLFNLRSFNNSEYSSKNRSGQPGSTVRSHGQAHGRTQNRSYIKQGDTNDDDLAGSQEEITNGYGISLKIYQRHDVQISSEPVAKNDDRQSSNESLPDGLTTTIKGGTPRSFLQDADNASDRSYPAVKVTSSV